MKINICCGANVFPGWINIDRTDVEADYLRHLRDAPKEMAWPAQQQALVDRIDEIEFRRHDVRKGLPFGDGTVDAIYIGQAIEHFNRRTEAPALLKECARVLRRGGVIRLTTPDLGLLCRDWYHEDLDRFADQQPAFFAEAPNDDQLSYLLFGASGAGSTNDNYEGHHHCYTDISLGKLLNECGLYPRTSDSPEFADCVDMGMSHSFAIEAVKP